MEPGAVAAEPQYHLPHDRAHGEVMLAMRGLGLPRLEEYRMLLDAGGPKPFAGRHVHRRLQRAAVWLLNREEPCVCDLCASVGRCKTTGTVFVA
ncbi:hypothetical protein E2562_038981 [Oryza meyeriana var. granulata]|uniref:Uncharacterized protein n=1 Tax=Oryza meyeriana var. granulata TaxID=110450 RepID=A0A6G1FGX1_9ORYZ|nr:hypothetical protein E2562_038981 [Oryza meyeriana var. granulata]